MSFDPTPLDLAQLAAKPGHGRTVVRIYDATGYVIPTPTWQ